MAPLPVGFPGQKARDLNQTNVLHRRLQRLAKTVVVFLPWIIHYAKPQVGRPEGLSSGRLIAGLIEFVRSYQRTKVIDAVFSNIYPILMKLVIDV